MGVRAKKLTPEYEEVEVTDPVTGKKVRIRVQESQKDPNLATGEDEQGRIAEIVDPKTGKKRKIRLKKRKKGDPNFVTGKEKENEMEEGKIVEIIDKKTGKKRKIRR